MDFNKKRGGEGVIFYPFLPMTFISPAESNLNVKCKKKKAKANKDAIVERLVLV